MYLSLLLYFGLLFLELYLVITLASTGVSAYDVKVHALDRLVHLNAKRREPPGPQNVNVYELCKSEHFDTFWLSNLCSACMTWRSVSSPKMILPILSMYGHLTKREDFLWNIWWYVFTLVSCKPLKIEASPRKSWSQSLKKKKKKRSYLPKNSKERAKILIQFNTYSV